MSYINEIPILLIIVSYIIYIPVRILYLSKTGSYKLFKEIVYLLLIAYAESLLYLTIFPSPGQTADGVSINLIPFETINRYIAFDGDVAIPMINLVGNIVVFIPIGIFAVLLYSSIKLRHVILIGFTCTLFIEFSQLILSSLGLLARSFDVDDLLLNTIGVVLGYILIKLLILL
ncbi:VanZ family protein [Ornithinibacillus halophilus]|uniref:VanZ like family protein n=1 Tax=Ornithinibacillus halophilus TaxID=930117 RepID=A0A1M5JLU6_9BACI|nr:VanZ family protein [Ornithinibacillus halophilus]SHG41542.1 VanZ like family protein [Ornithinibacillus halophilus]